MFVVSHQIAGITFRAELDTRYPGLLLSSRLQRFLVSDTKPDVYHRYHSVSPDSLTLPSLSEEDRERLTRCTCYPQDGLDSPLLRSPAVRARLEACADRPDWTTLELRPSSVAIFDFAQRELDVFYNPDLSEVLADSRVGPFAFAPFLPTFSAAMIHSSGLMRNDVVAMFLAPDEGGKTTVVKQSTAGTILCDDQVILRREGDIFLAYGTPWGAITSSSQRAKLGGFFLLEQAKQFELLPLRPVDVLEYLWNEHLIYHFLLPRRLKIHLFDVLRDLCHQIPAYRMRFPKDYVDWDAVDAAMAG